MILQALPQKSGQTRLTKKTKSAESSFVSRTVERKENIIRYLCFVHIWTHLTILDYETEFPMSEMPLRHSQVDYC